MARIARDRDTQLTPAEIASEALRLFDGGEEPSIRRLAAALSVAPSAIYHHFPSQARIVEAAVELVWLESTRDLLELLPEPFEAEPVEVLVSAGIATRRAFGRHPLLARHVADAWTPSPALAAVFALLANLFERIGLSDDEAAAAFHAYGTFTIGGILFAAARANAGAQAPEAQALPYRPDYEASDRDRSTAATRGAIEQVMDLAAVDPDRDEALFAAGLRRLVASFAPASE